MEGSRRPEQRAAAPPTEEAGILPVLETTAAMPVASLVASTSTDTSARAGSRRWWSIRTKFLTVIVCLLLASMVSFLALAIRLFEADKSAYVHDGSLVVAEAVAAETETLLHNVQRTLAAVATAVGSSASFEGRGAADLEMIKAMLASQPEIVSVALYNLDKTSSAKPAGTMRSPDVRYVAGDFLENLALDPAYFERLDQLRPVPLEAIAAQGLKIFDASLPDGAALLSLGYLASQATGRMVIVARVRHERLLRILHKSETYTTYVVDAAGQILLGSVSLAGAKVTADAAESPDPVLESGTQDTSLSARRRTVIDTVLSKRARSGTFEESTSFAEGVIAAYTKLELGGLAVISEISLEKAFLASKQLIHRSVAFAVLIILAALATSAVFTKRLTTSIETLYRATRKIGAGDFQVSVEARSHDEIGALAGSFNRMTGEIIDLMGQVRDKARMEKELETARLVQENLFPEPLLNYRGLELASFYMPASECGGDWCGYLTFGDQVIVLLGDATGHGVPAALITAAAQSCCMTLFRASTRGDRFVLNAQQIMEYLNFAVFHAAHGKVKMTFCVSVIDLETGLMTTCNASHEMPLVYRESETGAQARRELIGIDPDPCLGESLQSRYRQVSVQLNLGDVVVWYTDGLLGCRSSTGEEWGERRFVTSLVEHLGAAARDIKDRLIDDAFRFCDEGTRDDDVTCMVAKLTGKGERAAETTAAPITEV